MNNKTNGFREGFSFGLSIIAQPLLRFFFLLLCILILSHRQNSPRTKYIDLKRRKFLPVFPPTPISNFTIESFRRTNKNFECHKGTQKITDWSMICSRPYRPKTKSVVLTTGRLIVAHSKRNMSIGLLNSWTHNEIKEKIYFRSLPQWYVSSASLSL